MSRILKKQWLVDLLVGLMLALAALGLLTAPKTTSEAAREGLYICIDVLIPSLFPFFVISMLVIELGFARVLGKAFDGIMKPLFRVSGPCATAMVLGFVGGYPVGAKCAIALYEKGQCTKEEAERLLAFCNNSGPAFILGAVGIGILGSSRAGWLLYLAHMASSITVGLLFRFYPVKLFSKIRTKRTNNTECTNISECKKENSAAPKPGGGNGVVSLTDAFIRSVKSSFSSVFYISSFVIFFTVIIRLLYTSGALPYAAETISRLLEPFGMTAEAAQNILTGLIEVTSGLFSMQGTVTAKLAGKMAMAAFMLGWAGLSVHCQVLAFIGQSGLASWTYVVGKIMHGCISAVYAFLLTSLSGLDIPVTEAIATQVQTIAHMRFRDTLGITLLALGVALLLLLSAGLLLKRQKR